MIKTELQTHDLQILLPHKRNSPVNSLNLESNRNYLAVVLPTFFNLPVASFYDLITIRHPVCDLPYDALATSLTPSLIATEDTLTRPRDATIMLSAEIQVQDFQFSNQQQRQFDDYFRNHYQQSFLFSDRSWGSEMDMQGTQASDEGIMVIS
ncbi:hypothetical protein LguiA_007418 [Lonicera macranthoides]